MKDEKDEIALLMKEDKEETGSIVVKGLKNKKKV